MSVIGIGLFGCADTPRLGMVSALAASPLVRLVAVAGRTRGEAAMAAARLGCAAVNGYGALLERRDLDAVYAPLPPESQAEWIGKSLAAGKHVLIGEPLALNRMEAAMLVAAARMGGLLLMESFAFPRHSQHAVAQRLIDEGAIGELRSFTAALFLPPPLPSGMSGVFPSEAGPAPSALGRRGALLDTGVYALRAAGLQPGRNPQVEGVVLHRDRDTGVDVAGTVLLSTADGRIGNVAFGRDRLLARSNYFAQGSQGSITLPLAFTAPPGVRPVLRLERPEGVEERTLAADCQNDALVSAFATRILEGGDLIGPGEDILRQACLLDGVREIAERDRRQ
ncbi:Gfo/Idh/MocA family oxidoreductase [Streptomyces sp. AV19]|uniref:Gfo/Idh/MocA family protein n=1 Tax=Streptomyces sp. AV19 TaxID=2793068 RepID=UPI0018FE82DC|nr:Gfo/Idh/MocA family oxidoreductase [Streptomyces sp. AV19]MBH1937764.1 Gfo/Idh/MocA family oxidoreductase [Streptomyces sp. AV19]MDG4533652.1 Gfo/Idh/MocA family oxidoreductase [Streptomyces sp. AV19]